MNPKKIFEAMTLREKIAQMFLQYYQGYEDLPEHLIKMNKRNELGGIIFFSGNNVRNLEQLHKMCKNIQSHASENRFNLPFFLTIDQEGGQLTAIHEGTTVFPGNMSLGFANDSELAYRQGRHVGKELKYAGINICYAPVLDISYDNIHGIPIVDNRMYSSNPEVVADMGTGFIKGLQDEGILACGKHFPGMRLTQEDTHYKVDINPSSMDRLQKVELIPYKKAIREGLSCIMLHHGIFTAFDDRHPASLSKKVIDYLREELDFKGLIITDDLIMKAISNQYGEKDAVVHAINAGADLIIDTCAGPWFVDYVYECVQNGMISEDRINDAVMRILEYKEKANAGFIPDEKEFSLEEGNRLSAAIAQKALIQYKGTDDLIPIKLNKNEKLGIIFGNPARLVMSDATNLYDLSIKEVIQKKGYHYNIKEAIMPWHPTDEEIISLGDVAIISDVVIFTTVNAYHFDRQIKVLQYIREYCPDKLIISVATRSPEDARLLEPYSDVVIVTGGLTISILEALADVIFDHGQFEMNPAKRLK